MLQQAFHLRLYLVSALAFGLAFPPKPAAAAMPTPATLTARRLEVPILLYHHINEGKGKSTERYSVSRTDFEPD